VRTNRSRSRPIAVIAGQARRSASTAATRSAAVCPSDDEDVLSAAGDVRLANSSGLASGYRFPSRLAHSPDSMNAAQ
jgi:hypothetical protein